MLVNHSILKEFNDFDNLYSVELCQRYKHLNQFKIHCYSISDYQNLDDAIPLSGFENDSFGFAIDKKGGKYSSTSAYIIYFPEVCQKLQLSSDEIHACIAHEIAKILGISDNLSEALSKLINSGLYSEEQCTGMDYRKKWIQM